jgi:hypothetical protein
VLRYSPQSSQQLSRSTLKVKDRRKRGHYHQNTDMAFLLHAGPGRLKAEVTNFTDELEYCPVKFMTATLSVNYSVAGVFWARDTYARYISHRFKVLGIASLDE